MDSAIVSMKSLAMALLLFGLGQVREGMQRAFGARLKAGLAAGTRDGFRSFFAGLVATVCAAEFDGDRPDGGIILPRMAQVVLLGANVGTAMTARIVALGLGWLSPLLLLCGVVVAGAEARMPARGQVPRSSVLG